jgi:hypothetical protein
MPSIFIYLHILGTDNICPQFIQNGSEAIDGVSYYILVSQMSCVTDIKCLPIAPGTGAWIDTTSSCSFYPV